MKIIRRLLLTKFAREHADSDKSLKVWRQVVANAEWTRNADVLSENPTAKLIKGKRA